jgi:hypothetical protein
MIKKKQVRWVGHTVHREAKRKAYRFWVGKPEGTRQLGRIRCMWENEIKLILEK